MMFSKNIKNCLSKQHSENLINSTRIDLESIEKLLNALRYKNKHQSFKLLIQKGEAIQQYHERIAEFSENLQLLSSNKMKNKLKSAFISETDLFNTINRETGAIRSTIFNYFVAVNFEIINISEEIFSDKRVKLAIFETSSALQDQLQKGRSESELVDLHLKQNLPHLKKIKLKSTKLHQLHNEAIRKLAPFLNHHSDEKKVRAALIEYIKKINTLTEKYIVLIDLIAPYDRESLIQTIYQTLPWYRVSKEKEAILSNVLEKKEETYYEMLSQTHYSEIEVMEVVKKQYQLVEQLDDFNLFTAYSSGHKTRNQVYIKYQDHKNTQLILNNIPLQDKIFLIKLTAIIEQYGSRIEQEIKDKSIQDAIVLFQAMPDYIRINVDMLIDPDNCPTFKNMLLASSELRATKIYGKDVKKTPPNHPLADKIYKVLQDFLNDSNTKFLDKHRAKFIVQKLWHLYRELNKGTMDEATAQQILEKNISNFAYQICKINSKTFDFLNAIASLHPNKLKLIKVINNYAWTLPNEITILIFLLLDAKQLGVSARVCKKWNEVVSSPVLWNRFCVAEKLPITIQSENKAQSSSAKTMFYRTQNLKFRAETLNQFLRVNKLFFEQIVAKRGFADYYKFFIHLHHFTFEIKDGKLISNIIEPEEELSDKDYQFSALKEELKAITYLKIEEIKTQSGGYQLIITDFNVKQLREMTVDIENQLKPQGNCTNSKP